MHCFKTKRRVWVRHTLTLTVKIVFLTSKNCCDYHSSLLIFTVGKQIDLCSIDSFTLALKLYMPSPCCNYFDFTLFSFLSSCIQNKNPNQCYLKILLAEMKYRYYHSFYSHSLYYQPSIP